MRNFIGGISLDYYDTLLKIMLYVDYTLPNSSIIPEKSFTNVNITIKIKHYCCVHFYKELTSAYMLI